MQLPANSDGRHAATVVPAWSNTVVTAAAKLANISNGKAVMAAHTFMAGRACGSDGGIAVGSIHHGGDIRARSCHAVYTCVMCAPQHKDMKPWSSQSTLARVAL